MGKTNVIRAGSTHTLAILISISLCISLTVNSQEKYFSLENNSLYLYSHNFYVDSVIDARNQNGCIGFILKGAGINQAPAYFERPFCEEFQDFFSRSMPETEDGIPLIIRFNKFLISEYMMGEVTFNIIEVNITFIAHRDGIYFELFQACASRESDGQAHPGAIGTNITLTIGSCMNDFIERHKNGMLEEKQIAPGDLVENPLIWQGEMDKPDSDTLQGVFHTFYDFLNNRPDTGVTFYTEYIQGRKNTPETAEPRWPQNNKMIQDIWGFSDGQRYFVFLNQRYYPLVSLDGNIRLNALRESTSLGYYSPVVAAGVFGGLIGAAITAAVIATVDPKSREIVECQLDLGSGLIIPTDLLAFREMNTRMLFYLSRYLKPDATMDIYVDKEYHCTLSRNSYYYLTIPPDKTQVELCLKTGSGENCEILSIKPYEYTIYLCETKNGKAPSKERARFDIEKTILQKIGTGEIKEVCHHE